MLSKPLNIFLGSGESSYKILVKFPTRSRPAKFLSTLGKCITLSRESSTKYLVSYDLNDETMTEDVINTAKSLSPDKIMVVGGNSKNKIDACNRDMNRTSDWDIVVLLSDDMIPQQIGWDTTIMNKMMETYPDGDGVLFFNDGFRGEELNTMCILGKKYYNRFGYIYHPDYVSFYCDDEFMKVGYMLGKQKYFSEVLFKHEHPGNGFKKEYDQLYKVNAKNMRIDRDTFNRRKLQNFQIGEIK